MITNLLSSLVLIPLLLVDQEFQNYQPSNDISEQTLILRDSSNSSHMTIENIQLQLDEELTTLPQTTDVTTFEEEEVDEDFELEILNEDAENESSIKIRHLKHFLRTQNLSDEEIVNKLNATNEEIEGTTFLCYLSGGSTSLVCTASILSILLIAIDQYFAVTHPLRYHSFIDKFKSLILLVSTWLISTLFGLLGAFVQTDSSFWNFCPKSAPKNDFQFGYNIFYSFSYLILVILVPFVVICVIYGCIYCAAHRNSERMRKSNSGSSNTNLDTYVQIPLDENRLKVKVNSSDNLNVETSDVPRLPKVKSAPNFANLEKIRLNNLPSTKINEDNTIQPNAPVKITHANSLRSNPSFINSLKTKISNASLFKYREETRAAKISILVIFMVFVCYVPYGLALVMNTSLLNETSPKHFNCISLSLLVLANLLSPFLFAYRNRRIQRELRRLFGLLPKKNGRELTIVRERNMNRSCVYRPKENEDLATKEPFLQKHVIPEVVVTCKVENEKKSILKRVCSKGKTWGATKKCNFIPVPECLSVECRCSFSSASTQVSSEDYSVCN